MGAGLEPGPGLGLDLGPWLRLRLGPGLGSGLGVGIDRVLGDWKQRGSRDHSPTKIVQLGWQTFDLILVSTAKFGTINCI